MIAACHSQTYPELNFYGTVLSVEYVSGHNACQQLCTMTLRCQFFTYIFRKMQCNQQGYVLLFHLQNNLNVNFSSYPLGKKKLLEWCCFFYFLYSKCKCYLRMSANGSPDNIEAENEIVSGYSLRLCQTSKSPGEYRIKCSSVVFISWNRRCSFTLERLVSSLTWSFPDMLD